MAGRGRGRGRGRGGAMALTCEALGLGRGELSAMGGGTLRPPALFPPLDFKPTPLSSGDEYDYLLAVKQNFRSSLGDSPYFIEPECKKRDIARYSDKYHQHNRNTDNTIGWTPDWSRLPKELKIKVRSRSQQPSMPNKDLLHPNVKKDMKEDVTKKLETLEKKEEEKGEKAEDEDKEEEDEDIEEEYYDEEDMEEGTDYINSYFDNGEDFGADEDDGLDDGPTY